MQLSLLVAALSKLFNGGLILALKPTRNDNFFKQS